MRLSWCGQIYVDQHDVGRYQFLGLQRRGCVNANYAGGTRKEIVRCPSFWVATLDRLICSQLQYTRYEQVLRGADDNPFIIADTCGLTGDEAVFASLRNIIKGKHKNK